MKKIIAVIIICLLGAFSLSHAADWYVDNTAIGANTGTSWTNAWKSFASIQWDKKVLPGDTVYISGGSVSKQYNERLSIGGSGTSGKVITIRVGQDAPHNGVVIIDGTSLSLPGLSLSDVSYVKISGQVGSGSDCNIRVQNAYLGGVYVLGNTNNVEVAYLDITQNNRILGAAYGLAVIAAERATGLLADIHHCKIHNNRYVDEVNIVQTYLGTRTTYDQVLFHHNDVYDFHGDAIKVALEGASIYNNTIRDRGTYASDHPDGIQVWGGYTKIFNNTFYGFHRTDDNNVNSYIRYNPDGNPGHNGNPQYFWIYNNLFYEILPLTFAAGVNVRRGVELSFSDPTLTSANHIYFMNNTIVGTNFFGLFLGFNSTITTAKVSDIVIVNNLFQDCTMTTAGDHGANSLISIGNGGDGSITYGKWGDAVDVVLDYNVVYASSSPWSTNSQWRGQGFEWGIFKTNSKTNANPPNSNKDPMLTSGYKLGATSPYKYAGIPVYSPDIYGNINPPASTSWGIGTDVAAFGGAPTATTTTSALTTTPTPTTTVTTPTTTTTKKATPPTKTRIQNWWRMIWNR